MADFLNTKKLTMDNKAEFIGQIVDIFEDYLADRGIGLENSERDEALAEGEYEDETEAAIIYGSAYDLIGNPVEEILAAGNASGEDAAARIMEGFDDVLRDGGAEGVVPEADYKVLKEKVIDTFMRWHIMPETQPAMEDAEEER